MLTTEVVSKACSIKLVCVCSLKCVCVRAGSGLPGVLLTVVGKLKVLFCRHYSCGGMYWESVSVVLCAHGDK